MTEPATIALVQEGFVAVERTFPDADVILRDC
jgi:hypothetical protein